MPLDLFTVIVCGLKFLHINLDVYKSCLQDSKFIRSVCPSIILDVRITLAKSKKTHLMADRLE